MARPGDGIPALFHTLLALATLTFQGSPKAQPSQSITHPEPVPGLPPGDTRDPQVLPSHGLQEQQRVPLSSPFSGFSLPSLRKRGSLSPATQ